MIRALIFTTILTFTNISVSQAQKNTTRIRKPATVVGNPKLSSGLEVPQVKDVAFVVEIDRNKKLRVSIQNTEDSSDLSLNQASNLFLALSGGVTTKASTRLDPVAIIRPDRNLQSGSLVEVIQAIRVNSRSRVKVDCGQDLYLAVPPKPSDSALVDIKPNPLTLIVAVDPETNITLNNEVQGNLSDLSQLVRRLEEIFQARGQNGVFRSGSNEIETTVFLKPAITTPVGDLIAVANALQKAGARPIGLQVDSLKDQVETVRKALITR